MEVLQDGRKPCGGFHDGTKVEDSHVTLPDLPCIGFEGKADLCREMKALSD
jgi:D(-)-tartrate dehydratase